MMSKKVPHLGPNMGVHAKRSFDLLDYFQAISDRLRRVRVCCGDWSRVCGSTPVTVLKILTGVFLDPPYLQSERDPRAYAIESNVSAEVRAWCLEHSNNPKLRIALCGYEGEGHEELERHGWTIEHWKTAGGYSRIGNGKQNLGRERIWFSPHCLSSVRSGFGFDFPSYAGKPK
jgi:DNA adenine methylase